MCIVSDYLAYTKQWKAMYGDKTLVLLQVGSFYEAYGIRRDDNKIVGSNVEEFAQLNGMVIAERANQFEGHPLVMAGVGVLHIEKYLQMMQAHGYTVVLYKQDVNAKNTTRSLYEIISPGTYFANDISTTTLSNNVLCIWLKPTARRTLQQIGVGLVDIFTGKTAVFEFTTDGFHLASSYDELERYISAYSPNECLVVSQNLTEKVVNDIIDFVGLRHITVHKVNMDLEEKPWKVKAQNAEKQVYQKELLTQYFIATPNLYDTLREHELALQAFCLLLDFVYQHSPNLVKKLQAPTFENLTDRLVLGNHSLRQLNITDDSRHTGKLRSVSSLLNECVTAMGKRFFLYNLQNPITDVKKLEESYAETAYHMAHADEFMKQVRSPLSTLSDWEKIGRKMVMQKIMPDDFFQLAHDLQTVENLEFVGKEASFNYKKVATVLKADILRVFNTEGTLISSILFYINKGISSKLDQLMRQNLDSKEQLETIRAYLSSLLNTTTTAASSNSKLIKIHETAKSDATLQCTSLRATALQAQLKKLNLKEVTLSCKSLYSNETESFVLNLAALELHAATSKNDVIITSPDIKRLTGVNHLTKEETVEEMHKVLLNYTQEFLQKFEADFANLTKFITQLDMIQCKCYIAHKYNYCRPKIMDDDHGHESSSQVTFTGLRHPLIEQLQLNELYVTNDLQLNNTVKGLLLFGTNAVGKTSFIKSVGIALILAQAGLYVPCTTFTYRPYRAIYTRILGCDNLFKGLSTFAMEMCELRAILLNADKHSLVLGDEVCSGTESNSALSIFTAALEHLHAVNSTFLFATHFHEIVQYEEIKALTNLRLMHMAVHYDMQRQLLVYDRQLKAGPGAAMYGLEVCKALHLEPAFLQRAHDLRRKYDQSVHKADEVLSRLPTRYNAQKLAGGLCEICRANNATETHHLQHQQSANESNAYIGSFHKNHVANLISICETCHTQLHQHHTHLHHPAGPTQHKVVKTSTGYEIVPIIL